MAQDKQKTASKKTEGFCRMFIAAALIAEFVLLAAVVQNDVTLSGNESSRFTTIHAVVENGTFEIDDSLFPTVDRVRIDGRFYANKPLLFSVFLSGLYAPLHWIGGLSFQTHYHLLIFLLTVMGVVSFSLLLTFLFQKRLRALGAPCTTAVWLGLAVVFSTWIFSYGTSLNNHTPAAAMLFLFLMLLEHRGGCLTKVQAFGTGLLAALLTGTEIPTGGLFFCVGAVVLAASQRPRPWRPLLAYLAGFSTVTLGLAGLNFAVYGYPLDAYLVPGAFDFAESIHAPGVAGLRRPDNIGAYWFHIAFGQRGFVSHMPVMLFGIYYLLRHWRRVTRVQKLSAGAAGILFVFYGTRTGIFGGWAYGFRFFIPLIPLVFGWSAQWYLTARRRWQKNVFRMLIAVGCLTSAVGALNPWPVAYEGVATPPQAVEARVRSPFLSNLMVWAFEQNPRGPLFQWLAHDVYGRSTTLAYLWKEFTNRRQPERLKQVEALAQRWPR